MDFRNHVPPSGGRKARRVGAPVRSAKLEKNAARANVYAPVVKRCAGICRDDLSPHLLDSSGMCAGCRKIAGLK